MGLGLKGRLSAARLAIWELGFGVEGFGLNQQNFNVRA